MNQKKRIALGLLLVMALTLVCASMALATSESYNAYNLSYENGTLTYWLGGSSYKTTMPSNGKADVITDSNGIKWLVLTNSKTGKYVALDITFKTLYNTNLKITYKTVDYSFGESSMKAAFNEYGTNPVKENLRQEFTCTHWGTFVSGCPACMFNISAEPTASPDPGDIVEP